MFERGTGAVDALHRGFFAASGDARQVWARDTVRDDIFFLRDGAVTDELRARCQLGELRCPLERCPDSRLIARGGTRRRHHFAHRVAHTKHVASSIWRREAAEMLADWARRLRGAEVSIDEGEAVADVVVRSQRTGRAVTLRVTYNRRHDEPLEQLTRPEHQVVLGHTRGLLLPRKPHNRVPGAWWCGEPRLASDIVFARGAAIAVNPEARLVGTVVASAVASRAGLIPKQAAFAYPAVCLVIPLDDCRLDANGIRTPQLDAVLHQMSDNARAERRPAMAPAVSEPDDPQQAEFLRRAKGLSRQERLALLREMFLPPAS
jgi:hypothetical protein